MNKTLEKIIQLVGISLAAFFLCGYGDYPSTDLQAYIGYVSIKNLPTGSNQVSEIRFQALKEAAMTLGARGALAWRSAQMNQTLKSESSYLDGVFNFNRLLINKDVLPPVIAEADNEYNLASDEAVRTTSKIYRIISPARFVTTAPNWREYLWMNYEKPSMPDHTLLPQTQAEANIWNTYIATGWKEGLAQADEIFDVNLSQLKRDYNGIVLYRQLLDQHMVSSPYVAHADLGITGNSQELRINDQVERITADSELQVDARKWNPVITKDNSQTAAAYVEPK